LSAAPPNALKVAIGNDTPDRKEWKMRKWILMSIAAVCIALSGCAEFAAVMPDLASTMATGGGLTTEEIVSGLKEALTVGATNSATLASKIDGFNLNSAIRIPFPAEAVKVKDALLDAGLDNLVADFEKSLNRAAEEASKKAVPIFKDAILSMSFSDAKAILQGPNNAATEYLKAKTQTQLVAEFTPVVTNAVKTTDVTRYWTPIASAYNTITLFSGGTAVNPNLEEYVTQKALDGLFFLIAQEELKIREDPAARVTEILKKVFGSLG